MMLAVFVWSFGYAFEIGATGLGAKVFWAKVEYLGIVTVPFAWLVFALRYAGWDRLFTRRNLALLAAVPLATLLLVATNEAHGLIWSRTALSPSGRFLTLDYGAGFWVYWAYSYALLVLGTLFLVSMLVRSPRVYREQGAALLVAVAAPWVGNGMYVTGLSPAPNLDLTPFAFLLSGAAISWGFFRFRLLDIVPVARDAVVEGMDDGVVVVDTEGRVVDLNPAARRILDRPGGVPVGDPLRRLAPGLDALLADASGEERSEVRLGEDARRRSYDLSVSPLRDRAGRRTGRLLILHDVTERKRAEEELIRQKAELARSNAELENFAYLIAHDLRAPLRGVDGFSHILLEDHADRLDEEGRDLLRRVKDGALRMGQLIDDLLELSRLTRTEMRRQRVDLSALARTIVQDLERDRTAGPGVEFVISESPPPEGTPGYSRPRCATCSTTPGSSRPGSPIRGWSSGPRKRTASPSTSCATTASGLTRPTRTSSSASSSGSTPPRSSRAPAWGSRRCNASSSATGEGCGPRGPWAGAPPSTSRSPPTTGRRRVSRGVRRRSAGQDPLL